MIVNLTPHDVVIGNLTIASAVGIPAFPRAPRVSVTSAVVGVVEGIEIVRATYGAVTDLPAYCEGEYYIVSELVLLAVPDRADLLSPGDLVRDDAGRVVGCKNLVCS